MKRRKQIKPYIRRKPGGNKKVVGVTGHNKNLSYKGAMNKGYKLSPKGDYDKDGVINSKDCKPFDPKKQGWLHDLKMKQLKKQEEHFEAKREKEQKKLEDIRDELAVRNKVSSAKLKIKQAEMKEKQARIDEINREKRKITEIKEANRKAKIEIEKHSAWGAIKRGASAAGRGAIVASRGLSKAAVISGNAIVAADKALSRKTTVKRRPTKRRTVKRTKKRTVKRKKKKETSWI